MSSPDAHSANGASVAATARAPGHRWPLAVTTSDRMDPALEHRARTAAEQAQLPFIVRTHKLTLAILLEDAAEALVVFESSSVSLVERYGALRFSPGLGYLRVKQLDAGVREDMLWRIGELAEGDRVLDCTLGLAADAQVAARLVGPTGSVIGLEKSPALFMLVRHGLETLERHRLACPIEVLHADAADFLRSTPSGAFDVILFDPMFERKRPSSAAFNALRRHADYSPLTPEIIADAQRVATKAVVIKGSRYSSDFKKLGITPEPARRAATVLWAKLPGLGG